MNKNLKTVLYPIRKLASRFVNVNDNQNNLQSEDMNTIIFKAANIIVPEKVEGDYLEFGVFDGHSLINSYFTIKDVFDRYQVINLNRNEKEIMEIKKIWDDMRFFAFDSFKGLPEIKGVDREGHDFIKGKWMCSEEVFRENLKKSKIPLKKVITINGWFEQTCTDDTIKQHNMKKASIIHIDCDLYESTKIVLKFIEPLLVDGTIIIFDDWYCFRGNPNLGEQKAFNEWNSTLSKWIFTEYQKEGPWRNSFIVNKQIK